MFSSRGYASTDTQSIRIFLCGKDGDLLKYFETIEAQGRQLSFDELFDKAKGVYKMYGTSGAFHRALGGRYTSAETRIPAGSPWVPPQKDKSSAGLGAEKQKGTTRKNAKRKEKEKEVVEEEEEDSEPFEGDQVLAQATRYIFDTSISREAVYAVADGDIGRVWECLKVSSYD